MSLNDLETSNVCRRYRKFHELSIPKNFGARALSRAHR
eukprot:UN11849